MSAVPLLPPPLAALQPEANSKACPRPVVGLDFILNDAMRTDGAFDPSTFRLLLDGQDVTSRVQVRMAQTFPATRVSVLYTPTSDLAPGAHEVSIVYPASDVSKSAGSATYKWNFTVVAMPCP